MIAWAEPSCGFYSGSPKNGGLKIGKISREKAYAMGSFGKRIKKIGVQEHAGIDLENQIEERQLDMDEAGVYIQVLSATLMPG